MNNYYEPKYKIGDEYVGRITYDGGTSKPYSGTVVGVNPRFITVEYELKGGKLKQCYLTYVANNNKLTNKDINTTNE